MRKGVRHEKKVRQRFGHCVVCGVEGTSSNDFVCSECGDPFGVTFYCKSCGRRLSLEPTVARTFLLEHGYEIEDMNGLVMKVTGCGRCMLEHQVSDMTVFRLRIGR